MMAWACRKAGGAGVGIASMRERAAELGGDLVIEPNLPHGTRITAHLPGREQR